MAEYLCPPTDAPTEPTIDRMGFLDTLWHSIQLQRMGANKQPDLNMSGWRPFFKTVKEVMF